MAFTVDINIASDLAKHSALMEARAAALKGARLNVQIGHAVGELFKTHLFTLDARRPNQLGGKRTHFYADAATAVSTKGDDTTATVTVAQQGMRQRLEGGQIRAQKGKYLAIPARAEAYGRSPRQFLDLRFVPLGNGRAMLVEADSQKVSFGRRKDGKPTKGAVKGGGAMYWLIPSVTQKPDPTVIPSRDQIESVVHVTVNAALRRATT